MLHPSIRIRWINKAVGYGLFATQRIPQGTITYVDDELEIRIGPNNPLLENAVYSPIIERYGYLLADQKTRVVSWDLAKYMNHCCHANTLTTGYGFEVAIRDIEKGEEVTDDYTLFCDSHPMKIRCKNGLPCRGRIDRSDFDNLAPQWDVKIKEALGHLKGVEQPLWALLDNQTKNDLESYLDGRGPYLSVTGHFQ